MVFVLVFFRYFFLFLIYSFIGWCFEVLQEIVRHKKIVNRGFLIGPVVPIWGFGAIFITLICPSTDSIFSLIVSSAFIGTLLEYVVNYLMEMIFKARWWDYSHLPFNINGRVWLGSSLLFGVGGFFTIYYFNPLFLNLINMINSGVLCILGMFLLFIFVFDIIISCNIITKLKWSVNSIKKDYTEEVSKKVRAVLLERSESFRRILKAFPDVKFDFKRK